MRQPSQSRKPELLLNFLRRNWEIFLLTAIGLLLLLSLSSAGVISPESSRYPLARWLLKSLGILHMVVVPLMLPLSVLLAGVMLFMPRRSRLRRSLIDLFALWYTLRILLDFLLINLLLFVPVPDHTLLALQLVCFLPCLLLIWGWIYWRLDMHALKHHGKEMFQFNNASPSETRVYDYFLASFNSILSQTLSGFTGQTRFARTLIFLHGIMIWNVMALILTRAIGSISVIK